MAHYTVMSNAVHAPTVSTHIAYQNGSIAMSIDVVITELGNGFPDVGRYVRDEDKLYLVTGFSGPIHTDNAAGNYCYATAETADDDDCEEDEEYQAGICTVEEWEREGS